MSEISGALRRLPAVNVLLAKPEVEVLVASYGKELILFCIRDTLDQFRQRILQGASAPSEEVLVASAVDRVHRMLVPNLRKVINATGVVIHTNLGRAPFDKNTLERSLQTLTGYNNLEFDLGTGSRGDRNTHGAGIIKYLTGAEDVLVVNNNAAAVMLILRTFAKRKEVIVSRGELVEIGGSFRIPDVMAASDCKMVEVGTTNKTRIEDFKNALNPRTAVLFKAHRSNFLISGFTEEASLEELVALGNEAGLPLIYDLGSGLLRPVPGFITSGEPDVRTALEKGADLVCFSGDKLLGGPQAGIIVGKRDLIAKLKKQPLLRALRVCKLTLAVLEATCLNWLLQGEGRGNVVRQTINRPLTDVKSAAERLIERLMESGIQCEIEDTMGQVGGGTLPEATIPSCAVKLIYGVANKKRSGYAEKMHQRLLQAEIPVLALLKQGNLSFDMLCVTAEEEDSMFREIVDQHRLLLLSMNRS